VTFAQESVANAKVTFSIEAEHRQGKPGPVTGTVNTDGNGVAVFT
jgi:hypothetical protein